MEILLILAVIAAILLIIAVLIQNPKGGGLNTTMNLQGANQILGGASRSGDTLERITYILAAVIFVITLVSHLFIK